MKTPVLLLLLGIHGATAGVHIFQRMSGCEWDDETGEVKGFDQHGYDGEDFFALDLETETWIAPSPQAIIIKNKLDTNKAGLIYMKNYLTQRCHEWLKKFLNYGARSLQRTEKTTDMTTTTTIIIIAVVLVLLAIAAIGFFIYKKRIEECIVPAEMKTQEWFLPETTTSFSDLLLQYNGICGYTLVTRDGLLLPGNPHIGVMRHNDKLYVFSSKEAALKFASSPDYFIAEVLERAKLSPELIQLLKLHQQFSCVSPYSEMQPGESLLVKPMIKCEISTQTDLHPMETNIVRSYEWNEWQLRRNAIKLANLRTKVTHSAQSDLSHMRRDNVTQTWLPKDASCQGKREGGSSMPNPQTYLAGLRGQKDAHVVKINLTRPLEE